MFGRKNGSLLDRLVERHVSFVSGLGYGSYMDSWGRQEVRKNVKKDVDYLLKVVRDLDRVTVGKTSDGSEDMIHLIDGKGDQATLWVRGGNLRSISKY